MKALFDLFPILLFFVAYKAYDIYVATAVAIGASFCQVALYWFRHRRVESMHLLTLALIVVFGGATLLLRDEIFIKWKPTILNWLFFLAFLGSHLAGGRLLVQRMMGEAVTLPPETWRRLNLGWALFFLALGGVNLVVAYNFDTDVWVDFKLFGILGLTLAFILVQSLYIARHLKSDPEEEH
ncbi:MAG TPA: septation protein A [Gammaproteobacteria bacterium]|nr:septation protein A [Gammaproteobacteria bacterium]